MNLGTGPLIVQSDKTVLLEIDHDLAQEARTALAPFAVSYTHLTLPTTR